jgi:hypothetical protein
MGQGTGSQSGRGTGTGPGPRFPAERGPRDSDRGSGGRVTPPGRGGPSGTGPQGIRPGGTGPQGMRPGDSGFGQADRPGGRSILSGPGNFAGRDKGLGTGTAARAGGLDGLRAGPTLRWMGALRTRTAIYILSAATLLGVIGTMLTGKEPGSLLGFLILVGSVVATLGIRRGALYVIFPLPALANFIGAVVTGAVKDHSIDTSTAELGASFLQWIANVFVWICATTIIVLVLAGGRWLLSRQLVSGQFQMSAARRRGDRGPWDTADPWDNRSGPDAQRANRDQRDSRDPWGDRRPPSPRQSPSGPQPGGLVPPVGRNQPGRGNRGLPPDRPSRGQRPNRDQRDPRDRWA